MKNVILNLVYGLTLGFIFVFTSCNKEDVTNSDTLQSNEELKPGQYIASDNNIYRMYFQHDGNCVLYKNDTVAIWNTKSFGAVKCVMQEDGNFVLYNSQNKSIYDTQTYGNKGAKLKLEDDGNLTIVSLDNKIIWESKITNRLDSGKEIKPGDYIQSELNHFRLYFQRDGNLVIYETGGIVKWTASSFGANKCILQSDGNLVLYNSNGVALWNSNTSGDIGSYVLILAESKLPPDGRAHCNLNLFKNDGTFVDTIF